MSGSRKSLQRAAQTFNPTSENSWSKDDFKHGQKMLERMCWKKGEGIGRDGQGVKENINIRLKLDSKGLGFSIKEDEWVAVEHDFSTLLSNLNKICSRTKITKLSLESTSSSSRSRMHYRKFKLKDPASPPCRKRRKRSRTENVDVELPNNAVEIRDSSSEMKIKKRKLYCSEQLHANNDCIENRYINSTSSNDIENVVAEELKDLVIEARKSKTEDLSEISKIKSSSKKVKLNSASSVGSAGTDVSISPEIDDASSTKKVKKQKVKSESDLNPTLVIDKSEQNSKSILLKRYRESYLRNYLQSADESDSYIECDLNSEEPECENGADIDDQDGADVPKKMKNTNKKAKLVRERPLTKAERIVLKMKLLMTIQTKSCSHSFVGSNLNDIIGYGK